MTPEEDRAIELIAEAAKTLGWSIALHADQDDVQAITIGKASYIAELQATDIFSHVEETDDDDTIH